MSICLPVSQKAQVFSLAVNPDRSMLVTPLHEFSALSTTSLRATRATVWDLLVVKPDGQLSLMTHGLCEIPVQVCDPLERSLDTVVLDTHVSSLNLRHGPFIAASDSLWGTTTLTYQDGSRTQVTFDLSPLDRLVVDCFHLLALILPTEVTFPIHRLFLENWSAKAWSTSENVQYECFCSSLYTTFGLANLAPPVSTDPWIRLATSASHDHFVEDPALSKLRRPPSIPPPQPLQYVHEGNASHEWLAPVLYGLHILAENLRLSVPRHQDLRKLAPIICRIAIVVRPEWADYWKRLVPDALSGWPSPLTTRTSNQYLTGLPDAQHSLQLLSLSTIGYRSGPLTYQPFSTDASTPQIGMRHGTIYNMWSSGLV